RCVCDRSPAEPPQQPEPSCSAPCRCFELSPWSIACPDSFLFEALEFAVELLLWFTSPSDPPLSTRMAAFTFVCTPGADVEEEFAPWSTLFSPSCLCLLSFPSRRSPDLPPQQPEPSCSAPCRCFERSPWSIACPDSFLFEAREFAVELLLWFT